MSDPGDPSPQPDPEPGGIPGPGAPGPGIPGPGPSDPDPGPPTADAGRIEAELDAVDDALVRLDDGRYGTCAVCGAALGDDQLAADPTVDRCARHEASAGVAPRS